MVPAAGRFVLFVGLFVDFGLAYNPPLHTVLCYCSCLMILLEQQVKRVPDMSVL